MGEQLNALLNPAYKCGGLLCRSFPHHHLQPPWSASPILQKSQPENFIRDRSNTASTRTMDATGRHIDAFFTQHDGPLESYLRQQILGNARVVYSRPCPPYASSGPGGDDKDDGRGDEEFEVVLLSRLVTKGGFHEEIMAYTAILVGW